MSRLPRTSHRSREIFVQMLRMAMGEAVKEMLEYSFPYLLRLSTGRKHRLQFQTRRPSWLSI